MVGADEPETFSNLIPSILAKKHSFFVNKHIKNCNHEQDFLTIKVLSFVLGNNKYVPEN